ncbi:MAG: hypothetical protein ACMG6E_05955 [Candidatus Roizmanbacteria bacterium]
MENRTSHSDTEHTIRLITDTGREIIQGVSQGEAARRLGITKQHAKKVLGVMGIIPRSFGKVNIYTELDIEAVARVRELYPPVSGSKWSPPKGALKEAKAELRRLAPSE